jgi:hypothetical protein
MMMVTADQIVAHLVGDYILQSDWMATEKTKRSLAAGVHALTYALPFLFFRPSLAAFAFIVVTHFIIDRWRLARYVVYAKNFFGPWDWRPSRVPWVEYEATGYHISRPPWLTTWLLIIADNTLHLICNGIALKWLS